ncbi:MAG: hypothetical protein IJW26_02590 [Clostridia bacterium]|nr:hypothetical protein [Clostridia bacterium]
MQTKKTIKTILFLTFLLAIGVLYYLTLFVGGNIGNTSSFIIVALCFIYSLLYLDVKNFKILTQIALCFTVLADVFLVLLIPRTTQNQSIAMTFFTVTQLAYLVRLVKEQKSKTTNLINLYIRLPLIAVMLFVAYIVLKEKTNYLVIISVIYYVNLLLNVTFAFINVKKVPLLAIGLLLFMLCDTVVGLQVMTNSFIPIQNDFITFINSFNLAWLFYAPAQVLLSISAKDQPSIK